MAEKQVKVKVGTDVELEKVKALEDEVRRLENKRLRMKIDADTAALNETTQKLDEAEAKVAKMQAQRLRLGLTFEDAELTKAEQEVERLKNEKINLEIEVEKGKLDAIHSEMDAIEDDPINVQLNNQSAMEALGQISDGFSRIKQGAMEIGQEFASLLSSAGKQETNFAFLKNAVGDAEVAKKKMQEINDIVAKLPGDDTALQGLLSSAAAKDSSLTAANLESMANSATDYFSAMSYYGKSATEAQQDMTNYLLAGNTAELERSPILQGHIDKLKEATTVQERSKALAEALNEEHWGGMGAMDTYNNKLETFNGMIERGRYTLGGMFQEGAKGAMDFLLKLDENTNGLVGMTIAAAGFASPITDAVFGLGQMATGVKAIKDLGMIKYLKDLEITTKLAAAAQWLLNAAMDANPIVIVALAIVALIAILGYLYFNNEQVRAAIDGLGQTLMWVAGVIWDSIGAVIQWLSDQFNSFTSQLGLNTNDWVQAILGFILFLPTLPIRVAAELANVIARALGFKGNFVQTLWSAASNAVNRFASAINAIPQAIQNCLNWARDIIMNHPIVQAIQWLGSQMAWAFSVLGLGQSSPGKIVKAMKAELNWTQEAIEKSSLPSVSAGLGSSISDSFSPNLDVGVNGSSSGNGVGQVNNFYFSDIVVDDEKRMQKIVDYITRELNWDNKTAGRTI